jgi:hypothetical protein
MPVKIYRVTPAGERNEELAWLCDDNWLLGSQVDALSAWLEERGASLPRGEYVADIGFCWRRSASAGGPVIEPSTMKQMADVGMRLFLSEYPGFADELESEVAEPSAPPNSRPPQQSPASPEVQTPDSLRTPSSGGCG